VSYSIDTASGTVRETSRWACAAGAGPRHLALNARQDVVYVVNELSSSISVCAVDQDCKLGRKQQAGGH
jgi:6-phosphogluconolactonase